MLLLLNDDLLTIRFKGEKLDERSLPIFELGTSLIAIQRILHKAALYDKGLLEKGARLGDTEREQVALQISRHRKGSDIWSLTSYLRDPGYGPILQKVIEAALLAMGAYVWKKIKPGEKPKDNHILVINIFDQTKSISDRVGNIGGVNEVEIASPTFQRGEPVVKLIPTSWAPYYPVGLDSIGQQRRTVVVDSEFEGDPQKFSKSTLVELLLKELGNDICAGRFSFDPGSGRYREFTPAERCFIEACKGSA